MSCSLPVVACIQDVNRVISILNDAPTSGEQDVKESNGEEGFFLCQNTSSPSCRFSILRMNRRLIIYNCAIHFRSLVKP